MPVKKDVTVTITIETITQISIIKVMIITVEITIVLRVISVTPRIDPNHSTIQTSVTPTTVTKMTRTRIQISATPTTVTKATKIRDE
jgi:hypothetical protein